MTLSTSVPQQQRQKDAHAALVHLYEQHAPACFQLQRELLAAHPHASKYLSDPKNIFRFLKSSQFDLDEAARRVSKTLEWRSQQHFPPTANGLDLHAFRDRLSQLPTELQDMISVHTDATDLCGRPAAWLRLRSLRKISPATSSSSASVQHIGGMDALKSCFAEGLFEPMRMIMGQPQSGPGALQMALVVDLEGAGYANLELELVPWVLDTLKQHYPGLIGVVYLDNYSWLHSGLWSVFKRLMPQSALDKVVFTSSSQPLQAFLPDAAALSSLRHSLNADGRPLKRAAPASSLSDSTASFHSAHSAKDEMVRLAESTTASPPLASTVAPQLQQKPLRSALAHSPSSRRQQQKLSRAQASSPPASTLSLATIKRLLFSLFRATLGSLARSPAKRVKFASAPAAARPEGGWRLWFHCLCIFLIARSRWMDIFMRMVSDALLDVRSWYSAQDLLGLLLRSRSLAIL